MRLLLEFFTISISFKLNLAVSPDWLLVPQSREFANSVQTLAFSEVAALNASRIIAVESSRKRKKSVSDGENIRAMQKYFWGIAGGTVLELGAIDGNISSQSLIFTQLGWRRILIEANPKFRPALQTRKDALVVSAAICQSSRVVHYYKNPNFYVSGILEFMPVKTIKRFYNSIYSLGLVNGVFSVSNLNLTLFDPRRLVPVQCVPLSDIFETSGITHVNLMFLDVEGAELSVLKTINFDQCSFDVMVIENNDESSIRSFFATRSEYKEVEVIGRNIWYQHKNFSPSALDATN
jgi:FkbM family methyltransferase